MARTAEKSTSVSGLVNLLKQHRLSRLMSLTDMAKEFSVSVESYRQWELGKKRPALAKAELIAMKLGISRTDAIRFIEPSYRPPVAK